MIKSFTGCQMDQVEYTSTNKLAKAIDCSTLYIFLDKEKVRKSAIDSYYIVPSLVYAKVNGERVKQDISQFLNIKDSWVDIMRSDEWRYWVLVIDASTLKQFTKDEVTHEYYDVKLMRCKSQSVMEEIERSIVIDDFTEFV